MKIFLERENKDIEFKLEGKKTLKEILKKLDISLVSVILVKNDEIVLEDEIVNDKDEIKILSVVSGG